MNKHMLAFVDLQQDELCAASVPLQNFRLSFIDALVSPCSCRCAGHEAHCVPGNQLRRVWLPGAGSGRAVHAGKQPISRFFVFISLSDRAEAQPTACSVDCPPWNAAHKWQIAPMCRHALAGCMPSTP